MTPDERISQISRTLEAIRTGWPLLSEEIDTRLGELTEQLINNDNEQTRGQIKALRWVKELPASLQSTRDGMSAALADQAAAD
jgi:hypothetical protein